jgi:hypothetical protein
MKWFKRSHKEDVSAVLEVPRTCPHVVLLPHWERPENMGQEALADDFSCQACAARFSQAEAQHLRATEAERLRVGSGSLG